MDEISREITTRSNQLRGKNHFCKEPIVLEFFSPKCPNLSLIDLPGFLEVYKDPSTGIEHEVGPTIYAMNDHYIKQDRTIILMVVDGTQDIATS